ncbi:MAG: ABC transporter ATP-binding protein [Gemmatimonadaceae bacterium]
MMSGGGETTARGLVARFLRRDLSALLLAFGCLAVVVGCMFALAAWASTLMREIITAHSVSGLALHLGIGVAITMLLTAATFGRDFLLMRSSTRFASDLRMIMVARQLRRPVADVASAPAGAFISRISNDIALVHYALVRGLAVFAPNVMTVAALGIALVMASPVLAAATVGLAAPMLALVAYFGRRLQGTTRASQQQLANLTALAAECLDGAREAKLFGREAMLEARFRELSRAHLASALGEERAVALHPAAVTLGAVVGLAGLVFMSVWLRERGSLSDDALVRFLVLLGLAVGPMQEIARSSGTVARFIALMRRCVEMLQAPIEEDAPTAIVLQRGKGGRGGRVTMQRVRAEYAQSGFTLGPLDLSVEPGETVAIVGPSGAGKSTFIDLLPRLVLPTSGSIRIDGYDISQVTRASLRSHVAVVSQTPFLFSGTLLDNLRFSQPNATQSAVMRIAAEAHVDEFARRLPRGYETELQPRGGNLSVGQRQRIALARAMLADPLILLLDEPTSALDTESEQLLAAALARFSVGRTVCLVTHHDPLLALAQRVLVMEHGQIVADMPSTIYMAQRSANLSAADFTVPQA